MNLGQKFTGTKETWSGKTKTLEDECLLEKSKFQEEYDAEVAKKQKDISHLEILESNLRSISSQVTDKSEYLKGLPESETSEEVRKSYEEEIKSLSLQFKLQSVDKADTLRSLQRTNQNLIDLQKLISDSTNFCNSIIADFKLIVNQMYK